MNVTTLHVDTLMGDSIEDCHLEGKEPDFHLQDYFNAYSRMKHGSFPDIHNAARAMAWSLRGHLEASELKPEKIIFPVAYKEAPPACFFLAEQVAIHVPYATHLTKVYKDSVTTIDYATASQEERNRDLGSINFSLTEPIDPDALYVVVDDVRVTGAAEKEILSVLEAGGAQNVICLYYLKVEERLRVFPEVESFLNTYQVKSLNEMLSLTQSPDFRLTIRFLKRVLALTDEGFTTFCKKAPQRILEQSHAYLLLTGGSLLESNRGRLQQLSESSSPQQQRLSVYELDSAGKNFLLNTKEYSEFKHGNFYETEQYAKRMYDLITVHGLQDAVILSSPYRHVPTAAATLTGIMYKKGWVKEPEDRLRRKNITDGDYSTMGEAERNQFFDSKHVSVPREIIEGRVVVVVDDICMTGTHERATRAALMASGAKEVVSAYLINAEGVSLPPHFESELNESAPVDEAWFRRKVLCEFSSSVTPNLRLVKRWLSLPARVREDIKRSPGGWVFYAFDYLAEQESLSLED